MVTQDRPQSRAYLFLLGAPRGEIDGSPIQVKHRKPLALLAYLAVTQRAHTREALATLLWPDQETARAYAYLRNALWQLGQTPFAPWLAVDQEFVTLTEGLWVDVVAVEQAMAKSQSHDHPVPDLCPECVTGLSEVTRLYQGDFMEGFSLADCPDFDDWQFFQAEHLRQIAAVVLEKLTTFHSARGDLASALPYARHWAALDPLNEPAQRTLMTVYARDGQRAAALRQYDALLRDLKATGLQPTTETIKLYREIRSGQVEAARHPAVQSSVPTVPPSRPRHNLPAEATAFIGREAELMELRELLKKPECRLLTLVGPGGIGKTRLALRLGHLAIEAIPDGVFFVPFASVPTPDLMVNAVADALGVSFYPQSTITPQDQLLGYLGERAILLLFDNLEHLIDGTDLITRILEETPRAKLLATSRERLNLRGEWVMEVRGLAHSPKESVPDTMDRIYDAGQLFVETARRTTGSFEPTEEDLDAIARICALVEGMPLGIELAAAWTKMLPCTEIADEVEASLDFLTITLRDLPERHQSLRAVFARSWGLLLEEERRHFRALSVFRGGFTREAAQAVAHADLTGLSSLMDKSLLYRTADGRYETLEVLRQYAEEQLKAMPGEAEIVRARHVTYYLSLLQRMEAALKGDRKAGNPIGQRRALDILQADLGNIRNAWHWALSHDLFEQIEKAAMGLALFCEIRSRFREGAALFKEAADKLHVRYGLTRPGLLGMLLSIYGQFLGRFGHIEDAIEPLKEAHQLVEPEKGSTTWALIQILTSYIGAGLLYEVRQQRLQDSLDAYQALGDDWGTALSEEVLGEIYFEPGNYELAEPLFQESLELRRATGDEWGAAMSLYSLGICRVEEGSISEGIRYVEESMALREKLGDLRGATMCRSTIAFWLMQQGETDPVEVLYRESLQGYEAIGDLQSCANIWNALGDLATRRRDFGEAQSCYLSALGIWRRLYKKPQQARVLKALGRTAAQDSAPEVARSYLDQSLAIYRQLGDKDEIAEIAKLIAELETPDAA